MTRSKSGKPISAPAFLDELQRYRRGSVSRRHFMGVTGLGTATVALGRRCRGCGRGGHSRPARLALG